MIQLRTLFRNVTLLNIVLVAGIVVMLRYVIFPSQREISQALPAVKKTLSDKVATLPERHLPSLSDYTIVSEENLFHQERRIPPENKEESPALPKPDIVLYGTMITDDVRFAYLEDLKAPRNTLGRGKRQITMKEGDVLSGFILKEIEADKIIMMREQEKLVVSIHDNMKAKTRGAPAPSVQAPPHQQTQTPQIPPVKREPIRSRKAIDQEAFEFFQNRGR